jgi:hypothetical protein
MKMMYRAAVAALVGGFFFGGASVVSANDGIVFSGCITSRTDSTVTLNTSAKETIAIDTTWLTPGFKEILLADCVTVQTEKVDGKYMAESVEEGVDPDKQADKTAHAGDDDDHDSNSGDHDDQD